MGPTSNTAVIAMRLRRMIATRAMRRTALALTGTALVTPVALPATAAASGGGCASLSSEFYSCIQVDGSGLYVRDMKASIHLDIDQYVVGRLHVWGPGQTGQSTRRGWFNLYHDFSWQSGILTGRGYGPFTWPLHREVRRGPYCAEFEVNTGNGWQRSGNGPACLTVHP